MKVRDQYLAKAQTLTDAGVVTIPIPKGLKLQHIRLKIGATNGATSNTIGKLNPYVSKIEVVDGSDVWHSLSMREEQALNCFQNGFFPRKEMSAGAGVVIFEEAIACFGRHYKDRLFYLDTSRLSNPQLRVTYAFTVSATAGIATGTGSISAIARIIDDQASPYMGCVLAKEAKSWTTAASGDEPTILPLDYPYLALLVAALKTTVDPTTILTNLKLQRDAGKFIDYDLTGADVLGDNVDQLGYFLEEFRPLTDTAATWLGDLYALGGAFAGRPGATSKLLISSVTGESVVVAMTTGGTADANQITLRGAMPHASFYLPFGDGYAPEDALNPQGLAELKLLKTQGVVSAAGTVVTVQIRQ